MRTHDRASAHGNGGEREVRGSRPGDRAKRAISGAPLVLPILAVLSTACSEPTPLPPPLFPVDYATYTEVRRCRPSLEHGPDNIRVLASPDGVTTYNTRTGSFATGVILLKEQFNSNDTSCTGPIKQWTVMEQLAEGSSPDTLGWHWQRVTADRQTTMDDDETCIACHASCGQPGGGGYLATCTDP